MTAAKKSDGDGKVIVSEKLMKKAPGRQAANGDNLKPVFTPILRAPRSVAVEIVKAKNLGPRKDNQSYTIDDGLSSIPTFDTFEQYEEASKKEATTAAMADRVKKLTHHSEADLRSFELPAALLTAVLEAKQVKDKSKAERKATKDAKEAAKEAAKGEGESSPGASASTSTPAPAAV